MPYISPLWDHVQIVINEDTTVKIKQSYSEILNMFDCNSIIDMSETVWNVKNLGKFQIGKYASDFNHTTKTVTLKAKWVD